MNPNGWHTSLKSGKDAEGILDAYFREYYYILDIPLEREKTQKIDRWMQRRETGANVYIDYKKDDKAHTTGNLALEYIDGIFPGRLPKWGWVFSSHADLIFMWVPQADVVYALDLPAIKQRWMSLMFRYTPRLAATKDDATNCILYHTACCCVPIRELAKMGIITETFRLNRQQGDLYA